MFCSVAINVFTLLLHHHLSPHCFPFPGLVLYPPNRSSLVSLSSLPLTAAILCSACPCPSCCYICIITGLCHRSWIIKHLLQCYVPPCVYVTIWFPPRQAFVSYFCLAFRVKPPNTGVKSTQVCFSSLGADKAVGMRGPMRNLSTTLQSCSTVSPRWFLPVTLMGSHFSESQQTPFSLKSPLQRLKADGCESPFCCRQWCWGSFRVHSGSCCECCTAPS